MAIETHSVRILAVEVRRSCFGYAVFQGPKQLLDWGATTPYPLPHALPRAEKRFRFLLRTLPPAALVVKKPYHSISRGALIQFFKRETARCSIPMFTMTRKDIRKAFGIFRARNKYQIADALTRIFPELIFRLPPVRDTGDSERHAMLSFDAIATGFAYLQVSSLKAPPSPS